MKLKRLSNTDKTLQRFRQTFLVLSFKIIDELTEKWLSSTGFEKTIYPTFVSFALSLVHWKPLKTFFLNLQTQKDDEIESDVIATKTFCFFYANVLPLSIIVSLIVAFSLDEISVETIHNDSKDFA